MDDIKIIDNFLDSDVFLNIKNNILGEDFYWHLNNYKVTNKKTIDQIYDFQFIHNFYKNYSISSNFFNLIIPVLEKIKPSAILRIKANLTTATKDTVIYGMHTDYLNSLNKTAIFYLNSNNGKTIFENNQYVDAVENRLVVFSNNVSHSGTSCTDTKYRCVLNLNYYGGEY